MERVCAYCATEKGVPLEEQNTTHGICQRHFREQFAKLGFTPEEIEAECAKVRPQGWCPEM